jgi:hypothetical protein
MIVLQSTRRVPHKPILGDLPLLKVVIVINIYRNLEIPAKQKPLSGLLDISTTTKLILLE